ncbi:MAG: hypothetical protein AAGA54_37230 [Myxococcota bacterium]
MVQDQAGKAQLECLDAGVRIAASFSGTIEIAGQRVDSGGGSDVLIAEFDAVGELLASSTVGGPGNEDVEALHDGLLVLRANDTFRLAGRTLELPPPRQQIINPSNTLVIELGSNGRPQDVRAVLPNAAAVRAVRLEDGDVFVASSLYDEYGGDDPNTCSLSRWSAEGLSWTHPFPSHSVTHIHASGLRVLLASRHFDPDALHLTPVDTAAGEVRPPIVTVPIRAEDWEARAVVTDGTRLFGHRTPADADVQPFVAVAGGEAKPLAALGRLYDADAAGALVQVPLRRALSHGGETWDGVVLLEGGGATSMHARGRSWRGCLGPTHAFVLAECNDRPCVVATPRNHSTG